MITTGQQCTKDIDNHIKSCNVCQKTRPYNHPNKVPLKALPQPININHRVHMDLFGPLKNSLGGKSYVLVMTDAFSKYVELAVIPNKEGKTVANCFFERWILRYSTPAEILSDNGTEFVSSFMQTLCEKLAIFHNTTSPYTPTTNASAEIFNKYMKRYLQAFIDQPYTEWELYIPALQFSYNTSVSKATKYSPFQLLYGLETRLNSFDIDRLQPYAEDESIDPLLRLKKTRELAYANNLKYKELYTNTYNKQYKTNEKNININDFIFYRLPNQSKHPNPKLHPLYEGPYRVLTANDVNVQFKDKNNRLITCHINKVKRANLQSKNEESSSGQNKKKETAQQLRPAPPLEIDFDIADSSLGARPRTINPSPMAAATPPRAGGGTAAANDQQLTTQIAIPEDIHMQTLMDPTVVQLEIPENIPDNIEDEIENTELSLQDLSNALQEIENDDKDATMQFDSTTNILNEPLSPSLPSAIPQNNQGQKRAMLSPPEGAQPRPRPRPEPKNLYQALLRGQNPFKKQSDSSIPARSTRSQVQLPPQSLAPPSRPLEYRQYRQPQAQPLEEEDEPMELSRRHYDTNTIGIYR